MRTNIYLGGERISMSELSENISLIRDWNCRLIQVGGPSDGNYWRARYSGYTPDLDAAGEFRVETVYNDQLSGVIIELISPTQGDESKPTGQTAKDRILLTIKQAQNQRGSIGNKMCRWVIQSGTTAGQWAKKPLGSGGTWNPELAQEFKVNTLLDAYHNSSFKIDLLDQEEAERVSKIPVRFCFIEEALPPDLIEGLKIAPTNETYHGLILKYAGKMPPQSITEFNRLKEWIEFNCEPKVRLKAARPDIHFIDEITFHGTEVGTCQYELPTTARAPIAWHYDTILAIVNDRDLAPETVDEIMQRMDEQTDPWDYAPEQFDRVEPDGVVLSSFNRVSSRHDDWECVNADGRKARFITYLQGILPRERLEQLGIAP